MIFDILEKYLLELTFFTIVLFTRNSKFSSYEKMFYIGLDVNIINFEFFDLKLKMCEIKSFKIENLTLVYLTIFK